MYVMSIDGALTLYLHTNIFTTTYISWFVLQNGMWTMFACATGAILPIRNTQNSWNNWLIHKHVLFHPQYVSHVINLRHHKIKHWSWIKNHNRQCLFSTQRRDCFHESTKNICWNLKGCCWSNKKFDFLLVIWKIVYFLDRWTPSVAYHYSFAYSLCLIDLCIIWEVGLIQKAYFQEGIFSNHEKNKVA